MPGSPTPGPCFRRRTVGHQYLIELAPDYVNRLTISVVRKLTTGLEPGTGL